MAADREALHEYLMRLGWDISPDGARKFRETLEGVRKLAVRTTGVLTGIAVAAEAMVERFAGSMQRLHYVSQRTGASVKNIKGLEYAFEQVGLKAEDARAAIESMAMNVKLAPGLKELIRNLGVNPEGDQRDVMMNFLGKLKEFSDRGDFIVAAGYGEQFGWSPQMLQQMFANWKDVNAAMARHGALIDETKQDQEQAAEAADQFMKAVKDLQEQLKILGAVVLNNVLPHFREFNAVMQEFVKDVKSGEFNTWFERAAAVLWVFGNAVHGLSESFKELGASWDALKGGNVWEAIKAFGRAHAAPWRSIFAPESDAEKAANASMQSTPGGAVTGRIRGAGRAAAAASGLVGSIIAQESGGNQEAISPRGAIGTMQLLAGTARDMAKKLGVPFSLQRLMTDAKYNVQLGTEYLNTMLQRYGGNQMLATAAYNAGPGAVDSWLARFGDPRTGAISDSEFAARIPFSETRNYVSKVGAAAGANGVNLTQHNTITVTGGDATENGAAVQSALRRSNADIVRNLQTVLDPR